MAQLVVPGRADAGRIAALLNARALALGGTSEESADRVARWFSVPVLDPQADMRLAVDSSGVAVGYADVSGPEDGTREAWVDLRAARGAPDALERLVAWAQGRGAERVGEGGRIEFFVDRRDEELRRRLEADGYSVVRSSFTMERPLGGEVEPPTWPGGISSRPFELRDAEAVYAAHEEAFADHWGYTPSSFAGWTSQHLGEGEEREDVSLWRIAWDGDEIAGLCLSRPRRGEDEALGWIEVLAVRRAWRRRGLGEALLREAFSALAARGKRAAGLGVDAENTTNAVSLYERVGMRVVGRSDRWEKAV